MPKPLLFIIAFVFISGCASTGGQSSQTGAAPWQKNMAACKAATKQADWSITMMEVPAAGNAISNKMAAMTMKMGGSHTVDALVKILSQASRPTLAVYGDSDEMAAATLEVALNKLPSGAKYSRQPLCFIGDPQYEAQLKPAAERAGLLLMMVAKPLGMQSKANGARLDLFCMSSHLA